MAGMRSASTETRPLADQLRPQTLTEVVGQDHLLGEDAPITRMLAAGRLDSMVLWGPPGCGKTTLARILAEQSGLVFEPLSAVFSGVADLRKVFARAQERRAYDQGTVLFIDEIHRFNKSQQDSLLPYVEDGTVVLIGATTENPSFELNAAVLSRAPVYVLHRLDNAALSRLLLRVEGDAGRKLPVDDAAREALLAMADGDGRFLIGLAERLLALTADTDEVLGAVAMSQLLQKRAAVYDKAGEAHYNLISALHKSLRGSDCDAALYWFARMMDGGEDPRYVARRLTRFAVEDIGLAEPQALEHAISAWQAYERLGSPEGELALANCVIYLATAPKSNAAYKAFKQSARSAKKTGSLTPPKHILNAPTQLMKSLDYGKGYAYDHDSPEAFSGQNYFPDDMPRERFYQPVERGFEREIGKRLAWWDRQRQAESAKE
jgi:putative ATPase